jgi:hypothetical protein
MASVVDVTIATAVETVVATTDAQYPSPLPISIFFFSFLFFSDSFLSYSFFQISNQRFFLFSLTSRSIEQKGYLPVFNFAYLPFNDNIPPS